MKKLTSMLAKLPPQYKRVAVFGGIIVIIVLVSGTAAVLLSLRHSSSNVPEETGNGNGQLEELPAEREADKADKMAVEGDLEGGVEALDGQIESAKSDQDKYIFYSRKATLLFNNEKYDEALTAALEAYKLKQSSDSAAFVGQVAMEKGDNALALEYYKKALPLIDKNDPFADEDETYYRDVISGLEGGR